MTVIGTYFSFLRFQNEKYKFCMYSFSLLVNSILLKQIAHRAGLMKLVFCSKMQSEKVIGAYNALVKEINSLKDPMQEQSDAEVPFESDFSNCTVSSTTQPFGAFFTARMDKIQPTDCGDTENVYYKPQFFEAIMEHWLPMVPFWSSLLLGKHSH